MNRGMARSDYATWRGTYRWTVVEGGRCAATAQSDRRAVAGRDPRPQRWPACGMSSATRGLVSKLGKVRAGVDTPSHLLHLIGAVDRIQRNNAYSRLPGMNYWTDLFTPETF